jgi:hypothetical protein
VYSFEQQGTTVEGLSADGVEEAARHLAKATKGTDVIREIECHLESEDELEARFIATAGRYAIGVNKESGKVHEILLDTAIRGKRVDKIYRNGAINPFWYEHGVTKAVRNAKRALLPEDLIAQVIEQSHKLGRTQPVQRTTPTAAPGNGGNGEGPSISQKQIGFIRAMLDKAFPDQREQVEWMERTQPKAVEGTAITLGGLGKDDASKLIEELKALVGP